MDIEAILISVAATVLIFIPALALTARFALRPIVEAIIRLREGFVGYSSSPSLEERLAGVEAELAKMRDAFERLAEAQHVDRELRESRARQRLASGSVGPSESSVPE